MINATDVRDECEGLRKAFDMTCSVGSATKKVVGDGGGASGSGSASSSGKKDGGGRRKLKEWGLGRFLGWSDYGENLPENWQENIPENWQDNIPDNWQDNIPENWSNHFQTNDSDTSSWMESAITWFYRLRFGIQAWQSWLSSFVINRDDEEAFLFVEEEVMSKRIWKAAESMVERGVDLNVLAQDVGITAIMGHARRLNKTLDPNIPAEATVVLNK